VQNKTIRDIIPRTVLLRNCSLLSLLPLKSAVQNLCQALMVLKRISTLL